MTSSGRSTTATCASCVRWHALLRSFDAASPPDADVADPYSGTDRDFGVVLDQVERACGGLLDALSAVLPGDRV